VNDIKIENEEILCFKERDVPSPEAWKPSVYSKPKKNFIEIMEIFY
jgi:hypothetical protein